jgi:ABC-2 type transport system permease protein
VRNIFLLTLNTLKITFRKKSNIIVFLVIPVVIAVLSMALFANTSSGVTRIGIYNSDGGILAKDLIESLKGSEKFHIEMVEEKNINDSVSKGKIDCVLIIPDNFTESIYSGKKKELELVAIRGEDVTVWIENYVNFYVDNLLKISIASEGKRVEFDKIYTGFKAGEVKLSKEKLQDITNNKNVTNTGIGFLVMFMMVGASMTSGLVLKEKKNRTYFRVLSAPVSSRNYILGNAAANFIIILVQSVLVILGIRKLLRIETYVPDWQMLIILMSFGLVCIGFGLLIVAFSDSTVQAGNMSTLFITPTCMLGGCFWPVELMPQSLQRISYFMPQRWVLSAITKVQTGSSFNDILINLGIVVAFAASFFIISAYRLSNSDNVKNFV